MQKLLLTPLRLAVGWGLTPRVLGWIGITVLVLLRVSIGWHFFVDGTDKLRSNGQWSAKPFFANARGPFAWMYRDMVWDHDGELRLDRDKMKLAWARYRDQVIKHFGFDEEQQRQAQRNYAKAVDQYDYVIELNRPDIEEYRLGRERIEALEVDPVRDRVASLRGQREEIRKEWTLKIAPGLEQINMISENYETAQNAIATDKQIEERLPLELRLPATRMLDTSRLDRIVPYFDTVIGVCLLLGLFTPAAALAAAGFLGSVFLSQYPPAPGPGSTYYQMIECAACLAVAGTGAGRFAGLDFFLHLIVRKVWSEPTTDQE